MSPRLRGSAVAFLTRNVADGLCVMQEFAEPSSAVESVPPGAWAVGVSGGADSVALLSLLRMRADLSLRVVHLDHQTRGGASADDAKFATELARRWNLPCDLATLEQVLPEIHQPPKNRSARFRVARLATFRRVVEAYGLHGVILAHHAQDQAETMLAAALAARDFRARRHGAQRRNRRADDSPAHVGRDTHNCAPIFEPTIRRGVNTNATCRRHTRATVRARNLRRGRNWSLR